MKRKKESWNALTSEFGGSGRLQKRKVVKREKWKVCVWRRKNKGEKKNTVRVWRIKKEGKKMESQYFQNKF